MTAHPWIPAPRYPFHPHHEFKDGIGIRNPDGWLYCIPCAPLCTYYKMRGTRLPKGWRMIRRPAKIDRSLRCCRCDGRL